MEKIYGRYDDEHVIATKLYADASGVLYEDAEHTKPVIVSTLEEAANLERVAIAGLVIDTGAGMVYKALGFGVFDGRAGFYCAVPDDDEHALVPVLFAITDNIEY